jgi:hypothetical protein
MQSPTNWDWDNTNKPWRAWLVLFMYTDATGQAGAAMSVTSTGGSGVSGVTSGFATLTGLAGMSAANYLNYITITGASSSANNGTFQIVSVLSPTSIIIANPSAVAGDANNGVISWSVYSYPFIGPGPVWGAPQALWGDTARSWALNCSPFLIQSIRQILQRWKSAKTWYVNIIVSFAPPSPQTYLFGQQGDTFNPYTAPAFGRNPNGAYGNPVMNLAVGGLDGIAQQSRIGSNVGTGGAYADAYCDGTGQFVQCSVPNVT